MFFEGLGFFFLKSEASALNNQQIKIVFGFSDRNQKNRAIYVLYFETKRVIELLEYVFVSLVAEGRLTIEMLDLFSIQVRYKKTSSVHAKIYFKRAII